MFTSQVTSAKAWAWASSGASAGSDGLRARVARPLEYPRDHAADGAVVVDHEHGRVGAAVERHGNRARTLPSRSAVVNGFSTTVIPGSRMPRVAMTSAV